MNTNNGKKTIVSCNCKCESINELKRIKKMIVYIFNEIFALVVNYYDDTTVP